MINSIEPEKWKIITESGIIDQVKANDKRKRLQKQVHEEADRDYIFEGIFFSIPTTCLFVVMDVLVHRQFGEAYGGGDIFHKVIKVFPGNFFVLTLLHMHAPHFVVTCHVHKSKWGMYINYLSLCSCLSYIAILIMVYFSNKSKNSKFTQAVMFATSVLCGCYFLHTMFRSPAMGIMLRAPGIITILVYCIVQLNLLPAFISLALCGLYYKFGNVKYN